VTEKSKSRLEYDCIGQWKRGGMSRRSDIDDGAEQVRKLVGKHSIPVPWNLDVFIARIASRRAKPIRLIACPGLSASGQPCGIWIGRTTDDVIVYDDSTSGYHIEQIVLHEIGHILLQHHHNADRHGEPLTIQELVPDIDPASVSHVLGRTAYDSEQESQAELFASLVMAGSHRSDRESNFLNTFLRGSF